MSHESDPFEISKAWSDTQRAEYYRGKKRMQRTSTAAAGGTIAAGGHAMYQVRQNAKAEDRYKRALLGFGEHKGGVHEGKAFQEVVDASDAVVHHRMKTGKAALGAAGVAAVGTAGIIGQRAYNKRKFKQASLAKALNAAQQKQQKKANRWGLATVGGYGTAVGGTVAAMHNVERAEQHKGDHDFHRQMGDYHEAAGREATVEARRQAGFGPGHYDSAKRSATFARAHINPMHEARAAEFASGAKALKSIRNAKIAGGVAAAGLAGMVGTAIKADKEQKKVKALRTPRTPKTAAPIAKNDPFEISKMNDARLKRQKRAQAKINVAGATLGIGALGALGAGKAARPVLRTAKELGVLRPMVNEAKVDRFTSGAEKVRNTALTVGAGVGGVGGYNSASIMRAEGGKKKKPVQ